MALNYSRQEDLCVICQAIDLRAYLFQDPYAGPVILGPFQEILKRNTCKLCKLVVQALSSGIQDHWVEGIYPTEVCYMGRRGGRSHYRPMLEVWFDSTSETLPEGMFGHSTTCGEILAASEDEFPTDNRPAHTGRLIESSVDFSLLRSWLSVCDKNHEEKCGIIKEKVSSWGQHPLMLIDIKRRCLIKHEKRMRYLALSYVWGEVRVFKTLKSNKIQLQEDRALEIFGRQIPTVIKDAMEVVAALGENYLWVDALCIVQDDEFKLAQISKMHLIYGQATLTIFAIAGHDADVGLPGIRPNSRHLRQGCQVVQGMTLVTKLTDLGSILDNSCWGSRNWTFQEGIFSRRCLYFTEHQVYFQCRSGSRREDVPSECSGYLGAYNPLGRNILVTDKAFSPIFDIYDKLVRMYTRRELSYQSDILNAFSGIMSAVQERFGLAFLSALPVNFLDLALLWRPMGSSYPRFPFTQDPEKSSVRIFPSWCWTTVVGKIFWNYWRVGGYAGNDITLNPEIESFMVKDGAGLRVVETDRCGKSPSVPLATLNEFDFIAPELHLDLPILCFWAETISLDDLILSHEKQHPEQDNHPMIPNVKNRLFNKVWIYNSTNYHCGTLIGLESWPISPKFHIFKYEFVLLSRCHQKVVTNEDIKRNRNSLPVEYPSSQEYYDEMFDTYHYNPTVDWAANIMLIEWKGDDYGVRIAIGQIHIDAWRNADVNKKLVRLG